MNNKLKTIFAAISSLCILAGCVETGEYESRLDELEARLATLQTTASSINDNAVALRKALEGKVYVTGMEKTGDSGYVLSLSDDTSVTVVYGTIAAGIVPSIGIDADGTWTMSYDGGKTYTPIEGATGAFTGYGATPQVRIDADNYWSYSLDSGKTWQRVLNAAGLPISASDARQVSGTYSFFKLVEKVGDNVEFTLTDGNKYVLAYKAGSSVEISGYTPKMKIRLGETLAMKAALTDVKDAVFQVPAGWDAALFDDEFRVSAPEAGSAGEYTITTLVTSQGGLVKTLEYVFTLDPVSVNVSTCSTWNSFVAGEEIRGTKIADFSYAGYDHGMSCPPEVGTLGYKVYNVCDYGAVPDDGKSDREALIACLKAAFGVNPTSNSTGTQIVFTVSANAGVVIYFPEGEYILHTEADNVKQSDGYFDTQTIRIDGGGYVIRGAGADKTRIVIKDPLLPSNHETYVETSAGMYSSAWLFSLGLQSSADAAADTKYTSGTKVSGDAKKGEFTVKVSSAKGFTPGSWYCLRAMVKDADYIKAATAGNPLSSSWAINETGVSIREYHQVASVDGNLVTFVEPLLTDIDASKDFYLVKFIPNSGIGVEDMTFVGQTVNNFVHHGSWEPDGAYKTVAFYDCVNSWMRRCNFENVSEIVSFSYCACCSIYDLKLTGWRGHNNARVGRGTYNFYGKVIDTSDGLVHGSGCASIYTGGQNLEGAGSYHGPGVSYESSGNVFWRCQWGKDAGFESHGRQSKDNLWDACEGGFLSCRQGGGTDDMPNHMKGLVFWNFKSYNDWPGFSWWSGLTHMYVVDPIIVGIHGANVSFDKSIIVDESNGTPVDIESLYEAQLRLRLGYIPVWLNSLK